MDELKTHDQIAKEWQEKQDRQNQINKVRVTYFKKLWYDFKLETDFPEEAQIETFQEFIDEHTEMQHGGTLLYYDDGIAELRTLEEVFEGYLEMHKCIKTFQAVLSHYEDENNNMISGR